MVFFSRCFDEWNILKAHIIMKAPSSSSQITKAWVEYMLADYECKKTPETIVTVKTYEIRNGK